MAEDKTHKPETQARVSLRSMFDRDSVRRDLRNRDEQTLEARVDRWYQVDQHTVIPRHHFAGASSECIDTFRDGYPIACISLTQSVVDGLTRFLCQKLGVKVGNDIDRRIDRLAGTYSPRCIAAMRAVWGSRRHDFHHMNPSVPTEREVLDKMALGNVRLLALIEGEVFAFELTDGGKIKPRHPKLWPLNPDGTINVSVRLL